MNGILGFMDLLKKQTYTYKELKQFSSLIERSGRRLIDTINDLLKMAQLKSGTYPVHLEPVFTSDLVRMLARKYERSFRRKGISFAWEVRDDSDRKRLFLSDPEILSSIVHHLLENALQFTPRGGSTGLMLRKEDASIEVTVRDTGIGIPKEKHQLVFNCFSKADNRLDSGIQGCGVGLSISKAMVDLLGGRIWFESEEGKGSIFYVAVPEAREVSSMPTANKMEKVS
ncbi:MAG: HAMP domain-containing sensor histidine kinase [Bacteroidales bacterium]